VRCNLNLLSSRLIMKKTLIATAIILAGSLIGGCGPTLYNINVNGYTDPAVPGVIIPGDSFFVIENQKAPNPLLEKEIKDKINKLLERHGYTLASYDQARYYLLFSYGIGPQHNVEVAMPDYSYGIGLGGGGWGHGGSYFFGAPFFAFYPQPDRLYDRWLLLSVVDGKTYREKGQFSTIWVGEALSSGTSGDIRVSVNYLLLADFQQFGKNTGKAITVGIDKEGPQVQGLVK
jgi:Domain of unknown function (DUF4136)